PTWPRSVEGEELVTETTTTGPEVWETMWPEPSYGNLTHDITSNRLGAGDNIGAYITAFWVYLVVGLLGAFVISFYFSANTIIYYLLRREVDNNELDDVYLEATDEEFAEPDLTEPAAGSTAPTAAAAPTPPATGTGPAVFPAAESSTGTA